MFKLKFHHNKCYIIFFTISDSESDRFSIGYESSPTVRSPSPEKVQATSATNIGKKQPSNIRVAWSEHMNSRKTPTKRMTDVKSLISGRSTAGKGIYNCNKIRIH